MRFIIYGVGAIGGVLATALAAGGQEVLGIARGARLAAICEGGLTLRAPDKTLAARFDCVASPAEIAFRPDDAILLAMKSQDTLAALHALRDAGVTEQPIFCVQNGVANEPTALRYFPNVHGVNVMLPAEYMTPGETVCYGVPNYGVFDIGRYPNGSDAADAMLADVLTAAGIAGFVAEDVMAPKHGKLLLNLVNIVEAALGQGNRDSEIAEVLRSEGRAVLEAAGIAWRDVGNSDPRRELMQIKPVEGVERVGSSSVQSLARGAGSIETDYLNGEIVWLARMHGLSAPVNAYAMELAARLVRERLAPGAISREELAAGVGL